MRLSSKLLVGRDEELSVAAAALGELREGQPGVVVVSGPAGIGKTRFIDELAGQIRAGGSRVMVGACLDVGIGAPPLLALISAFRSVEPPAVQVLDALTGAVDIQRSRLFELLRSALTDLARRRPTVLVIEDLHWSDRITRDALLYLMAMAREGRWGLVVTFREDEVAARRAVHDFLDGLRRDTLAKITLNPLTLPEVTAQVADITGAAPPLRDIDRVYDRTAGIPLLVEEVLAAEAAGVSGASDHLRDWYLARIRRLGPRSARVVEVVAVVGEQCDERLVADALGVEREAVATALDKAVDGGFLVPDGGAYRMRHELLREAVHEVLPPARRRRLHRGVAAALAGVPHPDVPALAYHWYEADDAVKAAMANLDAAELAERLHAPIELRTYLHRALEHFAALPADRVTAVGGRGALLARAAEAAFLGGAFDQAVELAEASLAEPAERDVIAVRWERLARYYWANADGAGAQRAHERSLDQLRADAAPAVRAQVLAGHAWYLAMAGQLSAARSWSQQAVDAANHTDNPLDRCRALLAWGLPRAEDSAGLEALSEALALAVLCDTGDELGRAHAALGDALRQHGRIAESEEVLRDGHGYAVVHGMAGR